MAETCLCCGAVCPHRPEREDWVRIVLSFHAPTYCPTAANGGDCQEILATRVLCAQCAAVVRSALARIELRGVALRR